MKAEFLTSSLLPVAAVSGACHAVGSDYQDGKLSGGWEGEDAFPQAGVGSLEDSLEEGAIKLGPKA